jgi:hypothetical protein
MHGVGPLPTKSNGLLKNNKRENSEQDDELEDQQEDEPEDKEDATYTPSKVEPVKPHTRQLRPRKMVGNMKRKGGAADKEEPLPIEKNPRSIYRLIFTEFQTFRVFFLLSHAYSCNMANKTHVNNQKALKPGMSCYFSLRRTLKTSTSTPTSHAS